MSILITTYEGTHNHTLPPSATSMASTTSAAASMLLSGSSTSESASMTSTIATAATNLQGLNFYLSDGSKPRQLYLSNPASSPSHPTITLDLTSHPPSSSSSPFLRFNQPRYSSSSSLSFNKSSSETKNPLSWSSGLLLSNNTQPYSRNNIISSVNFGRQQMENMYQSFMQKNNNNNSNYSGIPPASVTADTISAATKVITADPSFQSALAAALTSFIGGGVGNTRGNQGGSVGESLSLGQNMKLGEVFPVPNSSSTLSVSNSKVNGCASSFLNKTPANTQTKSLMFLPPSLPSSTPESASTSPADNNDTTN